MLTKQQIKSAGSIFYASSAGCNPSIKVIEALAESLQYAPTEPGTPLSDKECNELNVSIYGGVSAEAIAVINRILANRRKLLEAKPQTTEERIIVKRLGASEAVFVYADGNIIGPQFETEKDAERYRLGLIAELAKERQ